MDILKLCLGCLFPSTKQDSNHELNQTHNGNLHSSGGNTYAQAASYSSSNGQQYSSIHGQQHHQQQQHSLQQNNHQQHGQQQNSHHQQQSNHHQQNGHQQPMIVQTNQVQYTSTDQIPSNVRHLSGIATFVIDGDTFQFYHQPNNETVPFKVNELKSKTIKVRIAGIDAPETDHGPNKPGQPFGNESRNFASSLILDKRIELEILDRDQYGRLVAMVHSGTVNVGLELLRNGLAHVYTGKGAQYGKFQNEFKNAFNDAKQSKRGLWSLSVVQTPSEFKRQH